MAITSIPNQSENQVTLRHPPTPPEVDLRRALRVGVLGAASAVLLSAMGVVETFTGRTIVDPNLTMGYTLLFLILFGAGYLAGSPPPVLEGMAAPRKGPRNVIAGLIAGSITGGGLAALLVLASLLNLRTIFLNISPALTELLSYGQSLGPGVGLNLVIGAFLGTAGGAVHLLSDRRRKPLLMAFVWLLLAGVLQDLFAQLMRGLGLQFLVRIMYKGTGGLTLIGAAIAWGLAFVIYFYLGKEKAPLQTHFAQLSPKQKRNFRYGTTVILVLVIAVLPIILGSFLSEVLNLVGIFLLMGLGLNIVVGFAGLLDLGYVAFYAVGAYTIAVLTSPSSPMFAPGLTFWLAIPFAVVAAALAGILVGTPVLRMRGDYLAIVTLGFGEIARLLAQSDWFKPIIGGAQGILRIPKIPFGPLQLHTPQELFYPILGFCLLAVYISWRVQDSRIGRAWMAMREDEQAAEAMGVNIVSAKLLAFITGAILASFSGAMFATKIGSIFPHSFNIMVSITVLVLIIIGGIGSIPGVMVGALFLVGVPQLLREFDEYREFFYGILLVIMMRLKPEGLLPNVRRSRELHEEEIQQDAWGKAETISTEPSAE